MAQRSELKLNVGKLNAAMREAAARGLQKGMEHVLQASRELVPLEEGTLARSGVASVDEGGLRGAVSYDTPYPAPRSSMNAWTFNTMRADPRSTWRFLLMLRPGLFRRSSRPRFGGP
ncbi:hypothetical protein GCM10017673_14920 [Streptosporangium violaceochromogenes]|nr:hypothetical protein GCM10017673_14920 [Streptosporangium violaceochromogenes]